MLIACVNRLEQGVCFWREHLILTPTQVAQHGAERHTVPDIPGRQIDLELLAGAHGQRIAIRTDLPGQRLGPIRYQHEPVLGRVDRCAGTADCPAAAATLDWTVIQAEHRHFHAACLSPRELSPLTLDDVQRFVDYVHQQGRKPKKKGDEPAPLAPRTVRNILTPLQEALAAAKRRKLVRENVALDVELPEAKAPDLYHLTPAEMRRFLAAVRGDRLEALYWLAALGMREGELLGLRWANVNLRARTVRVVEAMQRVKQESGPSKLAWVDMKTEHGKRTILLPEDWLHVLLAHKARQDEERAVDGWKEHNLVFPSTKGTPMEAQNLTNRSFKSALKRAELPADKIRFHDLRHAAASMFIALGYDARTVADILGHSSPDFTLRQYAHSFEEVRQRAVADVGKLLHPNAVVGGALGVTRTPDTRFRNSCPAHAT
jgi:integrase